MNPSEDSTGKRIASMKEMRVISLIGVAHGVSHFFHLVLPPLFPWLMSEFELSFVQVGSAMTVFFVISAFGQAIAGFAVDRIGAVKILYAGMCAFAASAICLSLAESLHWIYLSAALAGIGNSVFHPADYSILNHKISPSKIGHAFSVHGLSGNLGWAFAPVFVVGIASAHGWRIAALSSASVAVVALIGLWMNRKLLTVDPAQDRRHEAQQEAFAFLRVPEVWLCFLFFLFITAAFGAMQNYSASSLEQLYGLPLNLTSFGLSTYLFASAAGVFIGGFLAQRNANDAVITFALCVAAALAITIAAKGIPSWLVIPTMASMGFFTGIAVPSRDMLVRRAAKARLGDAAFGRIYGLVYSGLDAGFALSPMIFGVLMDSGHVSLVFVGIAAFQVLAVLTALKVGRGLARSSTAA